MRKFKCFYILCLIIFLFIYKISMPTQAKFSSDYTTDNDVVGLDLNFDIGISNVEEYQEIRVAANNHKAFNIEINNIHNDIIYYGVWYKMIVPKEINDDIKVARVNSSEVSTFDSIESLGDKTVSLVIINNTDSPIKVAIGVGTSVKSVGDIEYLGGKRLITDYANIPINMNASDYIRDLYHDEDKIKTVNIAGNKDKPKVLLNDDVGIMLDNNGDYRYYGTNPNNYVSFNGELWRIISVSKVYSDSSLKNGNYRVKLIRNSSFGSFAFDSSEDGIGVNNWSSSSIYKVLNNFYYNSIKEKCIIGKNNISVDCDFTNIGLNKESRDLIGETLFYLGGINSNNLDKMYANDYYNAERGNSVFNCETNSDSCPREHSFVSNVGLMYASDYAYSVNNISYNSVPFKYNNNIFSWLRLTSDDLGHEYTITPFSDIGDNVMSINYNYGNLTNMNYVMSDSKWVINNVSNSMKIRPVVYLRDNVNIVEGIGTEDNPYTLK